MTLQREKAEETTSEVLEMLENHGITDISSSDYKAIGDSFEEIKDVCNKGSTNSPLFF